MEKIFTVYKMVTKTQRTNLPKQRLFSHICAIHNGGSKKTKANPNPSKNPNP